jgi:YfiH family protein
MEFLTSRLLGAFPHGFTTRRGGHSGGPYQSLNLGGAVGDDPASVEANWAEVRRATGLAFARVRQVHGCRVHHAAGPAEAPAEEADVVVSARAGVAACVSVADCVPILVADPRSGAVAAVHAGWRGTLARAAEQAVAELARAHGARPADLVAAVGPSIGPCCYEVSADLAGRFREAFGPAAGNPSPLQARVDLWHASAAILRQAGLARERVEVLERCTSCEEDLFFSHRRDSGKTGRQAGFIAPVS